MLRHFLRSPRREQLGASFHSVSVSHNTCADREKKRKRPASGEGAAKPQDHCQMNPWTEGLAPPKSPDFARSSFILQTLDCLQSLKAPPHLARLIESAPLSLS